MPKVKIQSGDTLNKLATQHKTTVPDLLKANPNIKNPNLIFAGANLNIPGTEKKPSTIASTQTTTPTTTTTATDPVKQVVSDRAGAKSSKDTLIERLTSGISGAREFDPIERRIELEEERRVEEKRETIGTFEEEIQRTNEFLDTLESDLKERTGEFLITDPQRRRVLASEQSPLLKSLGIAERGARTAEAGLQREESVISDILRQEGDQATRPLDLLKGEVDIRKSIDDLFPDQNIESVASIVEAIDTIGEDPVAIFEELRAKGIDVGINEITETIEQIQSVRQEIEKDTQVIEVGGRQVLIDKNTGATIKDFGVKEAVGSPTEISEKFEAGQVVTDEEKATFKASIADQIKSFKAVSERDLGIGTLALYENAQTLFDLLNSGDVETGPIAGITKGTERVVSGENSPQNQFKAMSTIFTANFIKAISGAQVSDKERKFLMGALPSEFKQEQVNRDNTDMLMQFVTEKLEPLVGEDLSVLIPDSEQSEGGEVIIAPDGQEVIITD